MSAGADRSVSESAPPPAASPLILAYHRISSRPLPSGTWVFPRQLAAQLDALDRAGARFLAPDGIGCDGAAAGPPGVLLSFDDATADLHAHRSLLVRRGLRPVVFVPADLIGRRNDWEWSIPGRRTRHLHERELRELAALGWEIGLHGATHRDLVACPDERLADELEGGRRRLEASCGRPVRWLSYPYGRVDARVAAAARAAGLQAAFVLAARSGEPGVGPRWRLPRRPVYCIDTPADVVAKWRDPQGSGMAGRWQLAKEEAAHAVGRWAVARWGAPAARSAVRGEADRRGDQAVG